MICKKVFAAKEYRPNKANSYKIPLEIEINSPDLFPTAPQNDSKYDITLSNNYFLNTNYPAGSTTISAHNAFVVPFMRGIKIPTYIPKRMPFLLVSHNDKMDDCRLMLF